MNSPLIVDVQIELEEGEEPPSSGQLSNWAQHAYAAFSADPAEVTIRLVGEKEITQLNTQYRGKEGGTNVLSFAVIEDQDFPEQAQLATPLLGDVVVCHPVLVAEANAQRKTLNDHYAHLVTHGVLHLCGYDHQSEQQASAMEALEKKILAAQGIADPYA